MKKIISILLCFAMLLPIGNMNAYAYDVNYSGEEVLCFYEFEDETVLYEDMGFSGSGSLAYVAGKTGNGITPALVTGNFTYLERHLGYDFKASNNGVNLGHGTYHVRFSYNSYENALRNDFYIANSTANNAYKEIVLSTDVLNSYGNQWVEVDLEFTIPSLEWNVTVTPQSGDSYTGSGTYTNQGNLIPALNWWIKPTSNFKNTTPPTIDNFCITKELKNPELADNALTVTDKAGEITPNNKVPITGAVIRIDFGTEVAALGVKKEDVEIISNDDTSIDNTIDYIGYCNGSMWVMELNEALNYGTTYNVFVKAGIPDGLGMQFEEKVFEFSTVSNTVSGLYYDFEDETISYTDLGFETTGSEEYVIGKEGNGITAALISGNYSYLQRHMGFPINAQADGTYHIKYDFNAGTAAKENTLYFAKGTGSSATKSIILDTTELNIFGDRWVSVDVEFTVPSLKWKATITPEDGEIIEKTGEYTGSATNGVAAIQWWITPISNFSSYTPPIIDNFQITAEYDEAPVITKDKIAYYAGETEYQNDSIGADIDRIVLDFGQMMNTEDLTNENFIIRRKTDNTEIPVGISYKGFNEVILNIIPKTLDKNTEYELQIGDVSNISGQKIGAVSVFEFSVADGGVKAATVKKVIKDGKVVSDVSDLTAGTANLYTECENISKLGLISLYYNENEFVVADFSEVNVEEDGIVDLEFNVTDKTFDKVEFVLTDGFDSLKVLSEKTVLENELVIGEALEYAENDVETVYKINRTLGSDVVTVLGAADKDEAVLVFVIGSQPENAAMIKADENGVFSANLTFTRTGKYKIIAVGANDEKKSSYVDFGFTVFTEYKDAVDRIVLAEDADEFITLCENNKTALGIKEMYSEGAAKLYYKEFKNVIDNVNYDYDKNTKDFMRSYLIDALNNNKDIEAFEIINKLYSSDERLCNYMELYVAENTQKTFFTNKLLNKNIAVSERVAGASFDDELIDVVNIALILTSIKYADGPDEAKSVFADFKSIIGIENLTEKKTVYNKIRGNNYETIQGLKDAYTEALSQMNSNNGGGGSGSSGSSQGNKNVGMSPVTIFPADSSNNNSYKSIEIKFEDLDSVDWAYADISELFEKGIISGVSEARFNPLGEVKREQFIKMIVCAMGIENNTAESADFSDVPEDAWFEKYISIAKYNGLVSGVGNNMFGVNQNITRQDMAVMIYNAMCKKGFVNSGAKNNFADYNLCADYANNAIAELSALGIINGVGDNLYSPNETATRAQAAVIVNRALKYLS